MWKFEEYIKTHKIAALGVLQGAAEQYANIDHYSVYQKEIGYVGRRLFRIFEHTPSIFKKYASGERWYGDWKEYVADYDVFIIGNDLRGDDLIEYIQKHNSKARIIVHYESVVEKKDRKDPRRYKELSNLEFTTFDVQDSIKFGIRHVPFYYDPMYYDITSPPLPTWLRKKESIKQDVFFVGAAFNRVNELISIHDMFLKYGITDKMIIVKNPHHTYARKLKKYLYEKRVPYTTVIQDILQSRCILEVLQDKAQRSMSLRPMEAAIFGKKLITTNLAAVDYDMYSPENVFILGRDTIDNLKDFIYGPVKKVPQKIIDGYCWEAWLDKLLFGD